MLLQQSLLSYVVLYRDPVKPSPFHLPTHRLQVAATHWMVSRTSRCNYLIEVCIFVCSQIRNILKWNIFSRVEGVIWVYFSISWPSKTLTWRLMENKLLQQCKWHFLSPCQLYFWKTWTVIKCLLQAWFSESWYTKMPPLLGNLGIVQFHAEKTGISRTTAVFMYQGNIHWEKMQKEKRSHLRLKNVFRSHFSHSKQTTNFLNSWRTYLRTSEVRLIFI